MKSSFLLIIVSFLATSCSKSKQNASLLLEDAQDLFESGNYNQAKLRIDSLKETFPKEYDVLRDARQLMRKIDLSENERTLKYADSLLIEKRAAFDELKKDFSFEKDTVYEELGNYVYKGIGVERNVERNYLRPAVNEYGEMTIASIYYGKKNINHTHFTVESEGLSARTLDVPYDGGRNYRFEDNGFQSEIVTYKKEYENGVIDFIAMYPKNRLKITYGGDKPYVYYLDELTKKAIAKSLDLSLVLSDITRLEQEKKVATGKIEFFKQRITQKQSANEVQN